MTEEELNIAFIKAKSADPEAFARISDASGVPFTDLNAQPIGDRLRPAILDHFHVTVNSHRREVVSFLSGNPDSLSNIVRSLVLLRSRGAAVDVNQTICAQNADHLHLTARWLCSRFPFLRHFSWTCLDTLVARVREHPETVPSLRALGGPLRRAMRFLSRTGRTFRVEKVPLCHMGEFAPFATETRAIVKGEERTIDFLDERRRYREVSWRHGYGRGPACRACSLKKICAGLWDPGRGYDPAELEAQKKSPAPIVRRILTPARRAAR